MTRKTFRNLAIAGSFPGKTAGETQRTPIWLVALVLVIVPAVPVIVASLIHW